MFPSAQLSTENKPQVQKSADFDWLTLNSFQSSDVLQNSSDVVQQPSQSQRDGPSKYKRLISDDSSLDLDDFSDEEKYKHDKKKKSKKKNKLKKKKKKKLKEATKEDSKSQKVEVFFTGNKVFIEELPGLESKDAFRVDRKSDINTWNFGSIYKGHVAKYHDKIVECVGSTGLLKVEMKEKKQSKHSGLNRYWSKEGRKLIHSYPEQKVTVRDSQLCKPVEVISLSTEETSHDKVDIREQLLDSATSLYIKGKGAPSKEDDTQMNDGDKSLCNTVAEFNKKTRENPHNIQVWFDFIDFQDKLAAEDTKISMDSVQDKKISIIKKAIELNPGSITLKMKYLDLCRGIMPHEAVTKEMEQLLFIHPTNISLWQQYLLYQQSYMSKFTVGRVSKVYISCFQKLRGYMSGKLHTHTQNDNLHREVLDIFVQYCHFLRQVGQTEKAMASFQAQIELNMFTPFNGEDMYEEKMYLFESFWDSGVARVGEEGAKGWHYWYLNKDQPPEPLVTQMNTEDTEADILKQEVKKWKIWMKIEQERQNCHWLPWRPDLTKNETEEDCEDLDRLVLFDDIKDILMTFPSSMFSHLVFSFLRFLGTSIKGDSMLPNCCIENLDNIVIDPEQFVTDYTKDSTIRQTIISNTLDQMISKFEGHERSEFTIAKMYFCFEQCLKEGKKVSSKFKKIVKTILKEEYNRNDLAVWYAYCDILCQSGCESEAKTVCETALTLVNDNNIHKLDQIRLYLKLIEINLNIGTSSKIQSDSELYDLGRAQNVLLCYCEEKKDVKKYLEVSSIIVLRSREKLENKCDSQMEELTKLENLKQLSDKDLCYACCHYKMLALFEYSFGKNELDLSVYVLEDAVVHLNQFFLQMDEDSTIKKKVKSVMYDLLKYCVKLIKHHMTVNTAPLSSLRLTLDRALKLFPEDPYFIQVFIDTELKTYISGRLDRFFSHTIRSCDSPMPGVYGIYYVLLRQMSLDKHLAGDDTSVLPSSSGLINRLRSYTENALKRSQNCPLLWRLYLYSEVKFGNMKRAMGIFYRALQSCPWSKSLYMDAVALFSEDKLEEVLDLMTEKEIRLQIPLEEVDILLETKS